MAERPRTCPRRSAGACPSGGPPSGDTDRTGCSIVAGQLPPTTTIDGPEQGNTDGNRPHRRGARVADRIYDGNSKGHRFRPCQSPPQRADMLGPRAVGRDHRVRSKGDGHLAG